MALLAGSNIIACSILAFEVKVACPPPHTQIELPSSCRPMPSWSTASFHDIVICRAQDVSNRCIWLCTCPHVVVVRNHNGGCLQSGSFDQRTCPCPASHAFCQSLRVQLQPMQHQQVRSLTWESPWLQESTKSVELLNESQRTASESGTLMYDLEYELDSTRGRKRFLSTVAVRNKKLYIVNGTFKCGEDLCNDARPAVKIMQAMLRSFDVTA